MKTLRFDLTREEIYTIREALIDYHQKQLATRGGKPDEQTDATKYLRAEFNTALRSRDLD